MQLHAVSSHLRGGAIGSWAARALDGWKSLVCLERVDEVDSASCHLRYGGIVRWWSPPVPGRAGMRWRLIMTCRGKRVEGLRDDWMMETHAFDRFDG